MKSVTTPQFWKAYEKLDNNNQERARDIYRLWKDNPNHPSLHFKKIHSTKSIYSIRIGLGHRALGILHEETLIRFWIGSHQDYDKKVNQM